MDSVAHLDDLPEGTMRMVRVDERRVCLVRTSTGVHALDNACPHEGYGLTQGSVEYVLNQLLSPRTQKGILATLGDGDAVAQLDATRRAAEMFFAAVHDWHRSQPRGTGRVREPGIVPDVLSEELRKLANQLHDLASGRDSEEEKLELTSRGDRLGVMALSVREWLRQSLDGQVYWVEVRQGRVPRVARRAMRDVRHQRITAFRFAACSDITR